jgi:hypothetical protein
MEIAIENFFNTLCCSPSTLVARVVVIATANANVFNIDATASTIGTAAITYQYVINYVDTNGYPQTYGFGGSSATGVLNTSIDLVNYNGNGFETVLTISSTEGIDTTLYTDVENEQPYIIGAFNNGFDAGFSFNN